MGRGKGVQQISTANGGIGRSGEGGGGFGSLGTAFGSPSFWGTGCAPLSAVGCPGDGAIEAGGAEQWHPMMVSATDMVIMMMMMVMMMMVMMLMGHVVCS